MSAGQPSGDAGQRTWLWRGCGALAGLAIGSAGATVVLLVTFLSALTQR